MQTLSKDQTKQLRKEMKQLKKQGKEYSHLATCPTSYQLYLSILYRYNSKK